jgi:hypothetical protein
MHYITTSSIQSVVVLVSLPFASSVGAFVVCDRWKRKLKVKQPLVCSGITSIETFMKVSRLKMLDIRV